MWWGLALSKDAFQASSNLVLDGERLNFVHGQAVGRLKRKLHKHRLATGTAENFMLSLNVVEVEAWKRVFASERAFFDKPGLYFWVCCWEASPFISHLFRSPLTQSSLESICKAAWHIKVGG